MSENGLRPWSLKETRTVPTLNQERTYLVPKRLSSIDILEAERVSYYQDGRLKEKETRTLTRLNFQSGVENAPTNPAQAIGGLILGNLIVSVGLAILGSLFSER